MSTAGGSNSARNDGSLLPEVRCLISVLVFVGLSHVWLTFSIMNAMFCTTWCEFCGFPCMMSISKTKMEGLRVTIRDMTGQSYHCVRSSLNSWADCTCS